MILASQGAGPKVLSFPYQEYLTSWKQINSGFCGDAVGLLHSNVSQEMPDR
jgi:hypothetical protein